MSDRYVFMSSARSEASRSFSDASVSLLRFSHSSSHEGQPAGSTCASGGASSSGAASAAQHDSPAAVRERQILLGAGRKSALVPRSTPVTKAKVDRVMQLRADTVNRGERDRRAEEGHQEFL